MARVTGERITLREYRQEDLGDIRAWVTSEETIRYIGGAFWRPQTWEQTEAFLQRQLNGDAGGVSFVISDKDTLSYRGQCDLMMVDNRARKAELAVVIPEKYAGRGIGAEAVRLLCRYAFETMNLNRVYLNVYADNRRAVRCYEKVGFRAEGTLRQHAYEGGRYRDMIVMGLLRSEFEEEKIACTKEN